MKTARMLIGQDTIRLEIAATEETRQVGLMYRSGMPDNAGMLFVFDQPGRHPFWMRNTEFPLSIAFLDTGWRILDIQDMAPRDESTSHAPPSPALYALEMNQGWFRSHGVGIGAEVRILADSAK